MINFTPHHVLHTVHVSCHAISLDDGRMRKDVPGSGRDMCKDMDAIQTPHSNLFGFFGTSRNGRRTSCGRQVLVDEYKQLQQIQEFIRRTSYSTMDCISKLTNSNWLLW